MNWKQAATRAKRGGEAETIAVDFSEAERELAPLLGAVPPDAEALFHREFVRSLFERAVADVQAEYAARGRTIQFRVFERYDLDPDSGTYDQIAGELGLTPAQVTNYLAQVRRAFRTHALAALEALTGSREEFRREARDIFGLEVE